MTKRAVLVGALCALFVFAWLAVHHPFYTVAWAVLIVVAVAAAAVNEIGR